MPTPLLLHITQRMPSYIFSFPIENRCFEDDRSKRARVTRKAAKKATQTPPVFSTTKYYYVLLLIYTVVFFLLRPKRKYVNIMVTQRERERELSWTLSLLACTWYDGNCVEDTTSKYVKL